MRHSGTAYRKTTLAAQARTLLAAPSTGLMQPGKASRRPVPAGPQPALTGCVDKVAGLRAVHAGEVKLVDQAQFQGRPATVIVVQPTPATEPGTVYAAGAGCSASRADILAQAPDPAVPLDVPGGRVPGHPGSACREHASPRIG